MINNTWQICLKLYHSINLQLLIPILLYKNRPENKNKLHNNVRTFKTIILNVYSFYYRYILKLK